MSETTTAPQSRAIIKFSGADHKTFLQGQLTQDVNLLSESRPAMLSASCDAKGRVMAVLTLIHDPEGVLVGIRPDIADAWCQAISRYRLRAKVEITPLGDWTIARDPHDTPSLFELASQNGQPSGTRWRVGSGVEYVSTSTSDEDAASDIGEQRLLAGIAEPGPETVGNYTPHMLGLQHMNAISFNKGCYTGQEIVARTEHLGAAKRGPLLLSTDSAEPLTEGTDVFGEEKKLGTIATSVGRYGIAVVNLEYTGDVIAADGHSLQRV